MKRGWGQRPWQAAAARSSPIPRGIVGLLGPYIDTIVVCTVTALVLLITGEWMNAGGTNTGSVLTSTAFSSVLGDVGGWIVTITVIFFAFSTIISWSYYGEEGVTYLFGNGKTGVLVYRVIFVALFLLVPSVNSPQFLISPMPFLVCLAIPNLICNFLLSGKLESLKEYESDLKAGKI